MKNLSLIIILLTIINLNAIFDDYEPSPRARALSGTFYTLSNDANGIFYNPAGLTEADNNIQICYVPRYSDDFSILNTAAFCMKLPARLGSLGFGLLAHDVNYLDVNLMSEKIYSVAHGFTLLKDVHSTIQIGYSANLYHLEIYNMGDQSALGINLGALAILHKRTRIGFTVTNLNNPKMGRDNRHELPRKMIMGISYMPYEGVSTSLELKQTFGEELSDSGTEIHAGSEIALGDLFILRVGVRNRPASYSLGAGFNIHNIHLDYGFNTHAVLGLSHHFGLGYQF